MLYTGEAVLKAWSDLRNQGQKDPLLEKVHFYPESNNEDVVVFDGATETLAVANSTVSVVPNYPKDNQGSSKLQLNNIINYNWESSYIPGQLMAIHKSGDYWAYAICSPGSDSGIVRVMKSDKRALLKGMKGKVVDLSFSHIPDKVVLGIVDEFGEISIYSIKDNDKSDSLESERLLHIVPQTPSDSSEFRRITWCPYLPDEDEDSNDTNKSDDASKIVATSNGTSVEMWNIDVVAKKYGNGTLKNTEIDDGSLLISYGGDTIFDLSISPDGTAIATASQDGKVRFFQLYMQSKEAPRNLHEWSPHDGKSVDSIMFLDNRRDYKPGDQIWKYLITGGKINTEFKIWSCEDWSCLQTINLNANNDRSTVIKCAIDQSARYLLLSDTTHRNIYVLYFKERDNGKMSVVSISEFSTPSPFLFINISNAGVRKVTHVNHTIDEFLDSEDEEAEDDLEEPEEAHVIEFMVIQPKRLQSGKLTFKLVEELEPTEDLKDLKEKEILQITENKGEKEKNNEENGQDLEEAANKMMTLLSPEAFQANNENSQEEKIKKESLGDEILLTPNAIKKENPPSNNLLSLFRSGNSSPSREVRDILDNAEEFEDGDEEDDEESSESPHEDSDIESVEDEFLENNSESITNVVKAMLNLDEKKESNTNAGWNSQPIKMEIKQEPVDPEDVIVYSNNTTLQEDPNVMSRLNDIFRLIDSQNKEIANLREEIHSMKISQNKAVEQAIKKQEQHIISTVKQELRNRNESMISSVTKSVSCNVGQKIDSSIKHEVKKACSHAIQQSFENVTSTFEKDAKSRINKSEELIKQAIVKLSDSKTLKDALSENLLANLQQPVQTSFKQVFTNVVIPAFEKGVRNMLAQTNQTVTNGLKDHEAQLKNIMSMFKKDLNKQMIDPILIELKKNLSGKESLNTDNIVSVVQKVVNSEINEAFVNHGRSMNATPVLASGMGVPGTPTMADLEKIITSNLNQGNFDFAFQTALSSNNLALVVATCEKVNPSMIFSDAQCPLSQPTLLSMIQQLGHDLSNSTETKYTYLQESLTSLELDDPTTQTHVKSIVEGLQVHLNQFISRHPNKKITRQFRTLLMATSAFVN